MPKQRIHAVVGHFQPRQPRRSICIRQRTRRDMRAKGPCHVGQLDDVRIQRRFGRPLRRAPLQLRQHPNRNLVFLRTRDSI
jgi:hypothetical protein